MKTEGVKAWWVSLTPDRRKVVMGVGCLVLLLGVLYLFISAGPDRPQSRTHEAKADINLLTGSDARTLGLDSLGADLKVTQRTQRTLEGQLAKLQQEASTKKDLEKISTDIAALTQSFATLRDENGKRATPAQELKHDDSTGLSPASQEPVEVKPGTIDTGEAQRRGLFDHSDPISGSARTGKGSPDVAEPIKVHIYGESEPQAANRALPTEGDLYIPAGSILSGVLLTGVDVPTGMQSKRDPIPALMRIKHDAILPNRFRSDVRECFVVFGATGDLSTERALMRAETLSCIRNDGGVIEATLDAYAMGDDGKAGVRGRLVSRNGSLVAKAAFASFAEALSQVFRPVAIQGFSTTPGSRTQFQAPDTSEALEAAGYAGFGGAMRRLSEYFVDLADEIVPFIEVDAARQIEAVMLKGVTLKVRGGAV